MLPQSRVVTLAVTAQEIAETSSQFDSNSAAQTEVWHSIIQIHAWVKCIAYVNTVGKSRETQ